MEININKLRRSVQLLLQLIAEKEQNDGFALNLKKFLKKGVSEICT